MSSSSKTSQPSEPEGSTASSQTLIASGLMRRGRLSRREPPDSTCDVPGSSCWPSPTVEDARASRRHGYTIAGHSGTTLTDAMLLWYGIEASEEPPETHHNGCPGAWYRSRFVSSLYRYERAVSGDGAYSENVLLSSG